LKTGGESPPVFSKDPPLYSLVVSWLAPRLQEFHPIRQGNAGKWTEVTVNHGRETVFVEGAVPDACSFGRLLFFSGIPMNP